MKYKKGVTISNAFQKILDESNHKPNKIWVDKGYKFYKKSKKSWRRINSVWLNGWVFVYKLSGGGFESLCCYLNEIMVAEKWSRNLLEP